ncbi:MAG TPA: OsmC family protein [Candidatus Caenarcaniphilales bacterium]
MATIRRTASAIWKGDLPSGNGQINTASGVLQNTPYSFKTRFEQSPGTNPEELIAAAHAACYSMAFSHRLGEKGYQPQSIETRAVCSLEPQQAGGFKITKIRLETRGQVPGLDEATFKQIAQEAEKECPVSNVLRGGAEIELDAALS